jgi:hypothetical protein
MSKGRKAAQAAVGQTRPEAEHATIGQTHPKAAQSVIEQLCSNSKATPQRQNAENLKRIFPEKEYWGLSPNFHINVSVSELYIPTIGLPVLLEEICGLILGIYKSLTDTNVEIGAEAVLFPEKEYF